MRDKSETMRNEVLDPLFGYCPSDCRNWTLWSSHPCNSTNKEQQLLVKSEEDDEG